MRFWLDGKLDKCGRIKLLIKQEFLRIKGKASKNDKQEEKASLKNYKRASFGFKGNTKPANFSKRLPRSQMP